MFFSQNLKYLRKREEVSQQQLADNIGVTRSAMNSYERGVQPTYEVAGRMADHFKLSLDALIRYDLSALSEYQWAQLKSGSEIDITGRRLRLLTVSVNNEDKENIEMVDVPAQAGYARGYADPEYIAGLPKFQLPFLSRDKTFRCFQISGDSMPPVSHGDWVTASYIENWENIKEGTPCIVVTADDGVVFKLLYNHLKEEKQITLVSTNPVYSPYQLPAEEIREIWKYETHNSLEGAFGA